ncbi:MAG: phytanoyl-CoA dioxygenase family protein [Alphaproteobacteria bacterium]|nr:phytanoyl-CoA dioxygenase family protein [Alphaproteobacteria bacterium]
MVAKVLETVNRAVELFNLGQRQEAMVWVSSVPLNTWIGMPDFFQAIQAIALAAAQELLETDKILSREPATFEFYCKYLPPDNQQQLWLTVVTARLSHGDPTGALLAACHALAAQPEGVSVQALMAEAAAHSGAFDAAVIFARAASDRIEDGPLRERMTQIIALENRSKIRHHNAGGLAVSLLHQAEAYRATSAGTFFYQKIQATACPDAAWQGLFDIGQCFAYQSHNRLAMIVFEHIAEMVPSAGIAEQAYDECLARAEQWTNQVERRVRKMQAEMLALLPPEGDVCADWDLNAAQTSPSQLIDALRAHGVALIRGLIDPAIIAQVRAHVFADNPERRFFKPAEDLPREVIVGLVPESIASTMRQLNLIGPDGGTSHGRQIFPNNLTAEDLLTTTYHQDSAVFYQPLINMWVPLDDCGETAPGLSIVPESTRQIFATRRVDRDSFENFAIQDPSFSSEYQETTSVAPVFRAGDVLLFLGTVPHRTHLTSSMLERRRSLELRFVKPSWIIESLNIV